MYCPYTWSWLRSLRLALVVLTMFLAFGVVSVYARTGEGNLGLPILSTTGAPALPGGAPSLFSGVINVIYADGTPVVLSTHKVTLELCNTSCVTLTASLRPTSPGTYTYSFMPPTSVTGTVTIYVTASGLADDNGLVFPSVQTSIGTYAYTPSITTGTSTGTGTSAPIGTTSTPPATTPVNQLASQAVNTVQTPTQTSPIGAVLAVLTVLALAGSLLIFPSRH